VPYAAARGPGRAERVIETVEHLGGLQAQAPFPPYYGLWSRLAGFRPGDLAELLLNRAVVRIALMRSTIHLGFVAGMWRIDRARDAVTLIAGMFRDRVSARDRDAITAEGLRMLTFAAPETPSRDVRFAPLT
jgi:hypothetical protein